MRADAHKRAIELFEEVCDLPPEVRRAAIAERCGADEELRGLVERMVAEDATEDDAGLAIGGAVDLVDEGGVTGGSDAVPERLGRYRIIREIGRGGMGVVYEAEQDDPRRRVALKVIRGALVPPEVRARFRRESKLLARLDHPGIAHVYEAGSELIGGTETPFFAMEYIDGVPLDEHVAEGAASRRDILLLFERICDAVQHAHQKGVIHRDLKPANIIVKVGEASMSTSVGSGTVDGVGQPKILDFGVARLSESGGNATLQTHAGQIVGTLAYMSPEQIDAEPDGVDTRSDVYAIGVMLYRALSGRMPIDVRGKPIAEAVRLIREAQPKPLGSIDRALRGDLETIVATAMERDADRRYASAAELGEDIRRHRMRLPISARPASTAYQLSRFASRNKPLVAGVGATFAVLVAGVIGTSIGLVSALRANEQLETIASFQESRFADLQADRIGIMIRDAIFESFPDDEHAELGEGLGRVNFTSVAMATIGGSLFEPARGAIDADFSDQPRVRASLLHALALAMNRLGANEDALGVARSASDLRRSVLGPADLDTLASDQLVLTVLTELSRDEEALPAAQELAERAGAAYGPDHPAAFAARAVEAVALIGLGRFAETEEFVAPLIVEAQRSLGDDHEQTVALKRPLVVALSRLGRYDESSELAREVWESQVRTNGAEAMETIDAQINLGSELTYVGEVGESEALLREALEIGRRRLGDDHPVTLWAMSALIHALESKDQFALSAPLAAEVYARRSATLGAEHPDTLISLNSVANATAKVGRPERAVELYGRLYEAVVRSFGESHPDVLTAAFNLGFSLQQVGRLDEAEPYYRRSYEGLFEMFGAEHPSTLYVQGYYGSLVGELGRHEEADELLLGAIEIRRRTRGDDDPATLGARRDHVTMLIESGRLGDAEPRCHAVIRAHEAALGSDDVGTLEARGLLATLRRRQGRLQEAAELYREAVEQRTAALGADHPLTQAGVKALDDVLGELAAGAS